MDSIQSNRSTQGVKLVVRKNMTQSWSSPHKVEQMEENSATKIKKVLLVNKKGNSSMCYIWGQVSKIEAYKKEWGARSEMK